jgi:competence protein ComEA
MSYRVVAVAAGAAAVGMIAVRGVATQDRFPNGAGKSELVKVCSGCHDPDNVFAYSMTAREWTDTLNNMAERGTEATADEWQAIELYLDRYFATIPVNRAGSDELARTMDVMPAVGEAIVAYRREHGTFKTIDDLKRVPGLEAAKVDSRKARVIF